MWEQLTTSEVMTRMQSDKHTNMFNVVANLKHVNTHETNNWRLVSARSLFVCCVSSLVLVLSSSVAQFLALMIDHTVAQVCALFVSSSSPCLMRTLSDSLSDLSIYLTFLLFIPFVFLHFLLPFTFLFLDVVDYNHAHCRWGAGSPGLQELLHKKNGDKSAVAMLEKHVPYDRTWRPVVCDSSNTRQLGCVFQDMEPPKSLSILRKSSDIRKPTRRVKLTKAVARHADIRDQNPSLGMIFPGEPCQRSPNAPKFEDRSQEETEWQEQGEREAAWKLAKSVLKLKEKNKGAFFSPSENRCLPASTLKPEEREFVVDSGASMHMISKKDLNSAEMDTLTKSCSPTIVITANGEVQTHEEATVYVKELDIFLTMKVLENTPAVLSLGKLCAENGYSYEWINGQKPHLI